MIPYIILPANLCFLFSDKQVVKQVAGDKFVIDVEGGLFARKSLDKRKHPILYGTSISSSGGPRLILVSSPPEITFCTNL